MQFLWDTSTFSDLMREDPKVDARLAGILPGDRVSIRSIARGEILFGLGRLPPGRKRNGLEAKAQELFLDIPCDPVPEAAGDHYATLKLEQQRRGLSLNDNDLWIAATALALGAVLVTRDSDFQKIDGLTVEDWSS